MKLRHQEGSGSQQKGQKWLFVTRMDEGGEGGGTNERTAFVIRNGCGNTNSALSLPRLGLGITHAFVWWLFTRSRISRGSSISSRGLRGRIMREWYSGKCTLQYEEVYEWSNSTPGLTCLNPYTNTVLWLCLHCLLPGFPTLPERKSQAARSRSGAARQAQDGKLKVPVVARWLA